MNEEVHSKISSERTSSEATLLGKEHQYDETSEPPRRRPSWRRYIMPLCAHIIVFFTYSSIVLLVLNFRSGGSRHNPNILYSPANEILHWQVQELHLGDGITGSYSGYPRPELEEAWGNLLGNMNIRLSLEDLKAFNREEDAVQLPDGSGYIGSLNIYHEIHCVKWLHTHIYQEHYFPNLTDAKREENRLHSEHCLNQLRATAMCHGDVGMITYKWGNDSRKPKAAATAHQCIDYDRLVEWTNERTVDMFQPGFLIHPTLGPVYDDGHSQETAE
ncbi:hypothetical protein F5882DRAFT_481708 [Hyaloscypha sp. PMI_1271]|nr:hypothetical protein F5882DRAFT_481708 [Hyaloscypha sp. PMI_1271]